MATAPASLGTANEMNDKAYRKSNVGPSGAGRPITPARLSTSPKFVNCARMNARTIQPQSAFANWSPTVSRPIDVNDETRL